MHIGAARGGCAVNGHKLDLSDSSVDCRRQCRHKLSVVVLDAQAQQLNNCTRFCACLGTSHQRATSMMLLLEWDEALVPPEGFKCYCGTAALGKSVKKDAAGIAFHKKCLAIVGHADSGTHAIWSNLLQHVVSWVLACLF